MDFLLLQQVCIRRGGYKAIKSIADAEQQRDAGQRGCPQTRDVEDKGDAVLDRIGHHRFKQHIICFAQAVEGGVEHILHGVQDIKPNQQQHKVK